MKKEKIRTAEQEEMFRFICVILVVVIICAGVYLLTRAFVTKDLFKKEEETKVVEGTVNYDVALVGQILNRPYDNYYVFVYKKDGDSASQMSSMIYQYKAKEKSLHTYTVDLSNNMNSKYYAPDKENTKATSVDDFAFGETTLIKVKEGKVEKYIVDVEKMQKELGL